MGYAQNRCLGNLNDNVQRVRPLFPNVLRLRTAVATAMNSPVAVAHDRKWWCHIVSKI